MARSSENENLKPSFSTPLKSELLQPMSLQRNIIVATSKIDSTIASGTNCHECRDIGIELGIGLG